MHGQETAFAMAMKKVYWKYDQDYYHKEGS